MAYIAVTVREDGSETPASGAYKTNCRKATAEEAKAICEKSAAIATCKLTMFVLDEDTMTIACWAKYVPGVINWVSPSSEELRRIYGLPADANV